jgi:hypothetical protein
MLSNELINYAEALEAPTGGSAQKVHTALVADAQPHC